MPEKSGVKTRFNGLGEPEVDSLPGKLPKDIRQVKVVKQGYSWEKGVLRIKGSTVVADGIQARLEKK